jgi:Resolvase, N terminal domain
VLEEHASGADRSRPVLARLLRGIAAGETLVVVRLDRLARSVSHLLAVIEQLEANGAHFRSLHDPIDTTTPQGMFSLQVLGAVAQLERALIAERTKAGLQAARKRGRVGGNPGLRAGDPDAIRKVRARRDAAHLDGILTQLDAWLPTVRRMRPDQPWGDVVRVLNQKHTPPGRSSGYAARCGGWPTKASLRPACWTAPGHSRATTGWSVWSPASRRRRPTVRCSRSPPNSKPCANERRAAARDGTPRQSSIC